MASYEDQTNVQNQNHHGLNGNLQQTQVTVVMVPLLYHGHLNQLLHLSRFISSYSIPVHFVGTPTHNRQAKVRVQGWDPLSVSNIHFHEFPVSSYETPPPNPNDPTKFPLQIIPSLKASLKLREPTCSLLQKLSSTTTRLVVIHDTLIPYVIQDVRSIPNAETYCFHSGPAFNTYTCVWEQEGKPKLSDGELHKILENLPSDEGLPREFIEFLLFQQDSRVINSGNLYNTSRAIEAPYVDLLAKCKLMDTDNIWAVGPFNPVVINQQNNSGKKHHCLDWLDKQSPNSVILISFGSTTSLTDDEAKEIATGLEKSEQKFIWILRDADKGDIFDGEERKVQLPEGFEERTQGRGIIIRDWAPQLEILGHSSTGGFLSHCGWNSCMETITMGVPVAAWPMHSEQPRNAILLEKVLKICLMVRDCSRRDKIVTSATVENAVRRLIDSAEGDEMRKRAGELSKAVKESMMDGGVGRLEMDSFIAHIRRN